MTYDIAARAAGNVPGRAIGPRTIAHVGGLAARHRRKLILTVVATIALLGFEALRLVLREAQLHDVRAALHAIPPARIAAAAALTAISYFALTGYDLVALKSVGRPLPWRVAATGSFASYTLSQTLGLSLLTGGSARHRVYSAAGLDIGDVVRVTGIAGLTFWAGVGAVTGVALLALPGVAIGPVVIGAAAGKIAGVMLLALVATPFALRLAAVDRVRIWGYTLPVPTPVQQARLLAAALVDLLAAAAALFVLLPGVAAASFPAFFVSYAIAIVAGLVTHVPGGVGIFESVMLATTPGNRAAVFAALLLYRLIYYVAPLLVATGGIAVVEGWRYRRPIGRGLSLVQRGAHALAPGAVALMLFLGGLVLLVSGALPGAKGRLSSLEALLPLPFIESSHLAGSLVGTAMLLIAPALNARLRSGFQLARLLLVGGIVFSLLKGLDWEEALLQASILAVLQFCAPSFSRRGGILAGPPQWRAIAAAMAAVALSLWAGFFAYKHTPYSAELWWQFATHGDAPRFLRASFAAGVLLAAAALWHLVNRRGVPETVVALPADVAASTMARATRTDINLALTGDKNFILSAARDAFLMYRVQGRSWVVLGDPVGPEAAWSELVWSIRRACHAAGGWLCFFQASNAMLPLFVELGQSPIKYGEEAHVSLADFSLAGPAAKSLRHALRRCDAAGVVFSVESADTVPTLLTELRAVSDAWLRAKHGAEKRFSLGRFDPAYLQQFDIVVARVDRQAVAFANLWKTGTKRELSVDLMRHGPDAPKGTMEAMLTWLMQWGAREDYARFNLGIAPLSGMPNGPLAPTWARLAHALFDNGERLYGFAGLRAWKQKFSPDWEPRFIATPPGLTRVRALIDIVRLVN